MTAVRLWALALAIPIVGCGPKHSAADVERGQKAMTAALDSWKLNEAPDRLKSLADPVEYTDELRRSHRLLDYTLGKADRADPEVLRFPVKLMLKDVKGKAADRDVVFIVSLKSPIVIARDPYE